MHLLVAFLSIALGAVGQFVLKLAAGSLGPTGTGPIGFLWAVLRSPQVYLGLFCYGTSFVLWTWVLTQMELSRAYPLVGISYVIILFLSGYYLKEPITFYKLAGVGLIVFGVLLVSKK